MVRAGQYLDRQIGRVVHAGDIETGKFPQCDFAKRRRIDRGKRHVVSAHLPDDRQGKFVAQVRVTNHKLISRVHFHMDGYAVTVDVSCNQ